MTSPRTPANFGAAFTALLAAAGLSVDQVLRRRPVASRSTLFEWKKGVHLPEDVGPLMAVVELCLAEAVVRNTVLRTAPADMTGWLELLAEAKQSRDSRVAHARSRLSPNQHSSRQESAAGVGRLIGRWDPVVLGVHRAIGGGLLPPYVRRDHDELLDALLDPAVAANRLVVLRGSSSTGKSRAAYEAVAARLPHWPVLYPRCAAALGRLLQQGTANHTVLWLNELRHYVDDPDGGMPLFDLAELLHGRDHIVAVTTLWPHHWSAYNAAHHDRAATAGSVRAAHELLRVLPDLTGVDPGHLDAERGGVIDIPDAFTDEQLGQVRRLGDFVLDQALGAAQDAGTAGRLTQYLAGVPDLLAHYQGPGADPYGRALILAAMDAVRLGHTQLLSQDLLQQAAVGYLAAQDRVRLAAEEAWTGGWEYAARVLKGAIQALQPMPPEHGVGIAGYRLADYLDQLGRHCRADQMPPATFWAAAARYAHPANLGELGFAARDRGLYRYAAQLLKRSAAQGDTDAALGLITLLHPLHQTDSCPARHAATHAAFDRPAHVSSLLNCLDEMEAWEQLATLLARDPAAHTPLDDLVQVAWLLESLWAVGAEKQVEVLAERAVAQDSLNSHALAVLLNHLGEIGAHDQIAALLAGNPAARVLLDDARGVANLLASLWTVGAGKQGVILAKRAVARVPLSSPDEVAVLLNSLKKIGDRKQAIALAALDPAARVPLDNPYSVAALLRSLREAGADKQVAVLLARDPAARVSVDNPHSVAALLRSLREAGAEEQVVVLAERAATDISLHNPHVVANLLDALMEMGALEQVAALIARDPAAYVAPDDAPAVAALLRRLGKLEAHDQVAALLARDPAAHVLLDYPGEVAALLRSLHEVGAREQVAALLAREPAAHSPLLDDMFGLPDLLRVLRKVGAVEQANVLIDRLPAAGLFDEFVKFGDHRNRFTFGLEPDGSPAAQWGWKDLE
ncbi:hypothetical protein AB0C33_47230 [Nonomuraea sp. NPDC048881]|uniref:hypothetical protein n=1 Tax=Nonomuraea sp. NPDC048881 TaxID=3155030 RepID=UPI0033C983DE